MISRVGPLLAAAVAVFPEAAWAHAPVPGVGAFWNGVLHPVLVPLHLLALLGTGMALGQNAPRASRVALPLFVVALAAAVTLPGTGGLPAATLLAVALAAGLLTALGSGSVTLTTAIAVAAAAAVGLDSAPMEATAGQPGLTTLGTLAGSLLVVVLAGGLAAAAAAPWQRIAVRTAGSWIAAAALIALALATADPSSLT